MNKSNELIRFFKRPEIIIMLIATIGRIFLSNLLGIWYNSAQVYDDKLMITYALLPSHFAHPSYSSLVKTMGYPIFLDFVYLTGLPYSIVLTFVWIVASILAVKICKFITQNNWLLMFVYLFVLFTPAAFDSWIGTRLYRNSIIAPFVFICFELMILILFSTVKNKEISAKDILCQNIFLGIFFIFSYYIKEDGLWLLPCLILTILTVILISVIRYIKQKQERKKGRFIRLIAAFLIPIIIFMVGTNIYKSINYHYFGVAEINTRTEGELGRFAANVYKIKSDNRTIMVWAPYDAIEKAFEASKTLNQYPNLEYQIFHTPWFNNDIIANPIPGDFLTWVLRTALSNAGIWQSEKQVSDLFKQVNNELETAFETGALEKDNSFQINALACGRTFEEIVQLNKLIIDEYKSAIFLDSYILGGSELNDYTDITSCEYATTLTNTNLLPISVNAYIIEKNIGNNISSVIFDVYSVLNPIFLIISVFGIIITLIKLIRKKKMHDRAIYCCSVSIMAALLGISLLYAFAIAWFSEFIWLRDGMSKVILKFYGVGLVPLLSLFSSIGICLFFKNIQLPKRNINKNLNEKMENLDYNKPL